MYLVSVDSERGVEKRRRAVHGVISAIEADDLLVVPDGESMPERWPGLASALRWDERTGSWYGGWARDHYGTLIDDGPPPDDDGDCIRVVT
ncbi:MAG: hypothetical protein HY275_06750 [Gemmatimonadetes bacterium]|nr:hypothetical protein [Gemmatimonadota bacterium]